MGASQPPPWYILQNPWCVSSVHFCSVPLSHPLPDLSSVVLPSLSYVIATKLSIRLGHIRCEDTSSILHHVSCFNWRLSPDLVIFCIPTPFLFLNCSTPHWSLLYINKLTTTAIVNDLGGDNFNVFLLSIVDDIIEVFAKTADTILGGEGFDNRVNEVLASRLKCQVWRTRYRSLPLFFPESGVDPATHRDEGFQGYMALRGLLQDMHKNLSVSILD